MVEEVVLDGMGWPSTRIEYSEGQGWIYLPWGRLELAIGLMVVQKTDGNQEVQGSPRFVQSSNR